MTTNARAERFLANPGFAIVGVSRSRRKFGNLAFRELRRKGYRLYPVHPVADDIDGVRCYRHFCDLPAPVRAALIVLPPALALDAVRNAAAAGVREIWLQPGAESDQVLAACRAAGVEVIAGHCVLLFARPTGIHRVHRWCHDLRRTFVTDNRRDDGPA